MKRILSFLAVAIFMVLFCCACSGQHGELPSSATGYYKDKNNYEVAKEFGLIGEVPLFQSTKNCNGNKVVSPYLNVSDNSRVNFVIIASNGELAIVDVYLTSVRIIIDDSKAAPTAEFIFDESWLKTPTNYNNEGVDWHIKGVKYAFTNRHVEQVIVRISQHDLCGESTLPL